MKMTTSQKLSFVGLMLLVGGFVFFKVRYQQFVVPQGGMLPTLPPGKRLLVDKFKGKTLAEIHHDDIVVYQDGNYFFIWRVIGKPGDRLHIEGGRVTRNGVTANRREIPCELPAGFKNHTCFEDELGGSKVRVTYDGAIANEPGLMGKYELEVPAESLFLMGDCRNCSHDNRHSGPIKLEQVAGKIVWY